MKVGFYALLGKPNAGKSTLLNTLVGEKVSIVSWRPQTTRNKINGIANGTFGGSDYQLVFADTPGIQHGTDRLSAYMTESVKQAAGQADGIVYVLDASKRLDDAELNTIVRYSRTTSRMIVAVNKIDVCKNEQVVTILAALNAVPAIAVVPLSAERKQNIDPLWQELLKDLPDDGVPFYPTDIPTDCTLRFMAAEIVREKALKFLQQEIPHGIGVEIIRYDSREDGVEEIHADIVCEKDNHKAIIIGKGGETLKRIATAARKEMEELAGRPVYLKLWVKVRPSWRQNPDTLSLLGYDIKTLKE